APRFLRLEEDAAMDLLSVDTFQGIAEVHKEWSRLRPVQSGRSLLKDPRLLSGNVNKVGEPTAVLLRRDAFVTAGGFNANYVQIVDAALWLRLMVSWRVALVGEPLATFRVHMQQ